MNKPIKIRLHVLSPIHIGCDDVYEPTSFVINPEAQQLISFDPIDFIGILNDKEKKDLLSICEKGNLTSIIELYRFIFNKRSQIKGNKTDIAKSIIQRYTEVKGMPLNEGKIRQELNNFMLPRTAYTSYNNFPYIPGTSIKGSLRTGYLSMMAYSGGSNEGIKMILKGEPPISSITGKKNAKELEEELLGGTFSEDPFSLIKVGDALPMENVCKKILYAINRKKEGEKDTKGLPVIFETIRDGSIFDCNINMDTSTSRVKRPVYPEVLLKMVHEHYARVYSQELKISKSLGFNMPDFTKFQNKIKDSAFLIRLGRHSGAEAVTIEGNRNIKVSPPGKPAKFSNLGANTLWLASEEPRPQNNNGLIPFGWAVLEVLPFDIKNIHTSTTVSPRISSKEQETKIIDSNTIKKETKNNELVPETLTWENATLTWSPGNQMLKATKDNLKAELKVSDKNIVPANYHEILFEKRKSLTANIIIEKIGNAFKIIKIL